MCCGWWLLASARGGTASWERAIAEEVQPVASRSFRIGNCTVQAVAKGSHGRAGAVTAAERLRNGCGRVRRSGERRGSLRARLGSVLGMRLVR